MIYLKTLVLLCGQAKKKGVELLSDAVICRQLMWSARVVIWKEHVCVSLLQCGSEVFSKRWKLMAGKPLTGKQCCYIWTVRHGHSLSVLLTCSDCVWPLGDDGGTPWQGVRCLCRHEVQGHSNQRYLGCWIECMPFPNNNQLNEYNTVYPHIIATISLYRIIDR